MKPVVLLMLVIVVVQVSCEIKENYLFCSSSTVAAAA